MSLLSCGIGTIRKALAVNQNPRDAVPSGFGMAQIVAANTFVQILARADVAATSLTAAQHVNVKHDNQVLDFFGPAGFEPATS